MPVNDLSGLSGGPDWLQYLSQMYGIPPDQAAAMMQQQGSGMGYPQLSSGGPSLATAQNFMQNTTPRMAFAGRVPAGPPTVPVDPRSTAASPPAPAAPTGVGNIPVTSGMVPTPGASAPSAAGLPDLRGVTRMGSGVLATQPPSGPPAGVAGAAGLPDLSGIPRGPSGLLATAPNSGINAANVPDVGSQPSMATTPVPGPLATGGASGSLSTSNPRFIPIPRANAPAGGSGRAGGGGPMQTALNLAGMFGGGPGASGGPAATPQGGGNIPGPLASGSNAIDMASLYPARAARGQTPGPMNVNTADLYPYRTAMAGRYPLNPAAVASSGAAPWWS